MVRLLTSIGLVLTLLAVAGRPQSAGRAFAALYETSDVIDMVSEVSLTLTLEIHNFSGVDVSDGKLVIDSLVTPDEPYATIYALYITDRESVRASVEFVIAKEGYEDWEAGAAPLVFLEFAGENGEPQRHLVELAPATLTNGEEG